jgi:hypothetical protein
MKLGYIGPYHRSLSKSAEHYIVWALCRFKNGELAVINRYLLILFQI